MKRHFFLSFLVISIFNCSFGQNAQNKTTIVGTWRLIEFADLDSATEKWNYPYGQNPKGYFTYTKSGIVNLNISSEFPLKISEDSSKKYTINLYDFVWKNSFGYFGTYSVDSIHSVVIHHVTGGCLPYYIDTDQKRLFTLEGDTLIIGDNKTWKRVLVRAD
mgnify:CR=1 FL=1|jgi:hypothetical protein